MSKQDTSLDDIAQSITDLGNMFSQQLDTKVDSAKTEILGELSIFKREANTRLDKIEGSLTAIEADVKAIYGMLADVQKDVKTLRKIDKELDARMIRLENFAEKLSLQTGIPFKP